jgi:dCMP deaminase
MTNWDKRFMDLAEHIAQWSKDPSTKVGAVLVNPYTKVVIGMGYNGFPRGVVDHEWRYTNRAVKYEYVVHAELNAILNATEKLDEAILYVTLSPCNECAKAIIQSGITRVVYKDYRDNEYTSRMFKEAYVEMVKYNDGE